MDAVTLKVLAMFSLCAAVNAQNITDKAIGITAVPTERQGFKNLISIPYSPAEIGERGGLSTSDFNGFAYDGLKSLLIACDIDYKRKYFYMYDYSSKKIKLGENFNSSADESAVKFTEQHHAIGQDFIKLAVDWNSNNLYWTDSLMNTIYMQPGGPINDTTKYKDIFSEHLDVPRGIAVDPLNGYLFWTVNGARHAIERSSLLGQNKKSIVEDNVRWPYAVTVDIGEKRIYWSEPSFIGSADYDGLHRRGFKRYAYATYVDIALFDNAILAIDYQSGDLNLFDKNTGAAIVDKISGSTENYWGVCVYSNSTQPPAPKDHCAALSIKCQDMCVNEPDKATCVCRTGSVLTVDGIHCKEVGGMFHHAVIINTGADVCKINVKIVADHHDYTPVCFYKGSANETITSMDINMATREVYFSISKFIYSVPIDNTTADPVRRTLLAQSNQDIHDITFDWKNNNIYYAIGGDGNVNASIWLLNPDTGSTSMREMPSGTRPRDLVAVPHEDKLMWIVGQNKIAYTTLGLKDQDIKELVLEEDFTNPTHMYHDIKYETLYVLDTSITKTYLKEIHYNGTLSSNLEVDSSVLDFVLYKDYILFAKSSRSDVIFESADRTFLPSYQPTEYGTLDGINSVVGIMILDKAMQPEYPNPCGETKKQGGCEQICIPNANNSICACTMGFALDTDGKKCKSEPVVDDFILVSDIAYKKIYQISLGEPEKVIGIRTPDLGRPNGVLYNYKTGVVIWASDTEAQIWSVKLDGNNATLLSDTGLEYRATPDFFAFDPSTGNVYYSAVSYDRDELKDSFIGVISPNGYHTKVIYQGDLPSHIALHPEKGYMFWSEGGDEPAILRANMDGTDIKRIITDDLTWPNGVALDLDGNRLFCMDGFHDVIYQSDFDGNNRTVFFEDPKAHLMDLRIVGEYLYYTAWENVNIKRLKLNDVTNVLEIGPSVGLGLLHGLDIHSSTSTQVPVSTVCSTNNGDCSHFCLPTRTGHTCGCDMYNDLLSDGKNCENVPRCPLSLASASVSDDDTCLRIVGSECSFTCTSKYKNKDGISSLTCTDQTDENGYQKWNIDEPCQEMFCPTVPNVILPSTCTRTVGENCGNYTCSPGYERNNNVSELVCGTDESWSNSEPLCIERCPTFTPDLAHATLKPSCMRGVGDVCSFTCDKKYKYSSDVKNVTCLTGSMWNNDTRMICQEIKCKDYIDNGVVSENCSLLLDAVCQYQCYDSFEQNSDVKQISCQGDGVWDVMATKTKKQACIAVEMSTTQDMVGVGVGVSLGVVILIILIIILLVYLVRTGKLSFGKETKSPTGRTSFENPRYEGDTVNIVPMSGSEADKGFGYATLEDETTLAAGSTGNGASAQNNVYDNIS